MAVAPGGAAGRAATVGKKRARRARGEKNRTFAGSVALVTVRASQDPGLWSGARYLSLSNVARPKRAYLTWPDRSALI